MKGQGIIAGMIAQRFRLARKRLLLDRGTGSLDTSAFRPLKDGSWVCSSVWPSCSMKVGELVTDHSSGVLS
jgi:hypothetical protein